MDVDWIREKLEEFIELCERSMELRPMNDDLPALRRREATIRAIMNAISPSLAEKFTLEWSAGDPVPEEEAKAQAERCLGFALDRSEWEIRLAPDSPNLPADRLHPWVWDSAKTLWSSQHFRQAVQAAATSVNAKLQHKVGRRDVSDSELVRETFGAGSPTPDRPRLRLPGDQTDKTVQSRQQGALQLGQACVQYIRNPASHEDVEWDEQIALEQLAVLSLFARIVEECEVRPV